jgi:ComF family protein
MTAINQTQRIDWFLNLLFPENCVSCDGKADSHRIAPICRNCWSQLRRYAGPQCRVCGTPLVSPVSITCEKCLKNPPPFTKARFYGRFEGVLREAIHQFKYYGKKRLAVSLAPLIATSLEGSVEEIDDKTLLTPAPIHVNRLRERQYNQSALLAYECAKLTGIPLVVDACIRIRETRPQVELSRIERELNVKDAFAVDNPAMVQDKKVILIDDVITTYATVKECSKALKMAGAVEITIITLAHG